MVGMISTILGLFGISNGQTVPKEQIVQQTINIDADNWIDARVQKNLAVLAALKDANDNHGVPRKVDHWVYFSNQ